ncbi:MAG: plastocyanin/azurin family copper-binding protein [Actinomycetota bacterium]
MLSRRVMALLMAGPLLVTTGCGNAVRQQPNAEKATPLSLPSVLATINPAAPSSVAPTKATAASSAAPSSSAASSGAASSGAAPGSPAAPGGASEIKAVIESKFMPDNLTVKVGTEVTWINAGGSHTVVGGVDAADPASPIGDHPLANEGDTVKVVFDKPGTYPFSCLPHKDLGMKGQIVVS